MTKLLLDENLFAGLIQKISTHFPGSTHVSIVGLKSALDNDIWEYAKQENFIIVSKDADFWEKALLLGAPPKVVWVRRKNCSTEVICSLLLANVENIKALSENEQSSFISLY